MQYRPVSEITDEELREIFEKIPKTDKIFATTDGKSFEEFEKIFRLSDYFAVFDAGFLRFEEVEALNAIAAHGVFWSHKVYGFIDEIREILDDLLVDTECSDMFVAVPFDSRGLRRLIKKIGFKPKMIVQDTFDGVETSMLLSRWRS